MAIDKYIKDNKVAVLATADYGSGWYTTHGFIDLVFEPKLVELVLAGEPRSVQTQYVKYMYGNRQEIRYLLDYTGSPEIQIPRLEVHWVPVGTRFIITEYDGYEDVWPESHIDWIGA